MARAEIIYPELSYVITGLCFKAHNQLGRYGREKQYGDVLEKHLQESGLPYEREKPLPLVDVSNMRTNIVDFEIAGKILVDLKAKPVVSKEDFYQMQRYLQAGNYKLGLIVNFRNTYLKPLRVVRIDS